MFLFNGGNENSCWHDESNPEGVLFLRRYRRGLSPLGAPELCPGVGEHRLALAGAIRIRLRERIFECQLYSKSLPQLSFRLALCAAVRIGKSYIETCTISCTGRRAALVSCGVGAADLFICALVPHENAWETIIQSSMDRSGRGVAALPSPRPCDSWLTVTCTTSRDRHSARFLTDPVS